MKLSPREKRLLRTSESLFVVTTCVLMGLCFYQTSPVVHVDYLSEASAAEYCWPCNALWVRELCIIMFMVSILIVYYRSLDTDPKTPSKHL